MKQLLERLYQKFLLVAAGAGLLTIALAGGSDGHKISTENLKDSVIFETVTIKPHGQIEPILESLPDRQLLM